MQQAAPQPPGPYSRFPFTQLFSLRRDLIGFFGRVCGQYGDIARVNVGPRELFFFNHPELIQGVLLTHHRNFVKSRGLQMSKKLLGEGLLTSEGDFHRRQRRLAAPAFHRQRLQNYSEVMVQCAEEIAAQWRSGQQVDVSREMMRLTLTIAGETLFGANVRDVADRVGEALAQAMNLFDRVTNPLGHLLDRLPLPSNRRFQRAVATLDGVVFRMIEERRREASDRGDLLSMLLLARDEDGDGGQMTDEQIRDEVMTIFLAGHETTALALTWTWHLLARNPAVRRRMEEEIDSVLNGLSPTLAMMPQLPYTRQVLAESMRLYPPAYVIGRQAVEEYEAGGFLLPAGAPILMCQFVMHRDPRFFPEPEKFDPDRWTPEAQAARPRFSYFPFGGGPRVCIGEQFAWMEGVLVLAALASRWRVVIDPNRPVEYRQTMTLKPKSGLPATLEQRHRSGVSRKH